MSSAIAYESVTGAAAWLIRKLVLAEHAMRGPFTGKISEVVAERNFARVAAHGNGSYRFTLFGEDLDVPDQYYFGLAGQ